MKTSAGVPPWLAAALVVPPLVSGFLSAPVWRHYFVRRLQLAEEAEGKIQRSGGLGFFRSKEDFLTSMRTLGVIVSAHAEPDQADLGALETLDNDDDIDIDDLELLDD